MRKKINKATVNTFILLIVLSTPCSPTEKQGKKVIEKVKHPRIVNIINFIRLLEPREEAVTEEVLYQTVRQGVVTLEPSYANGGGDSVWVNWYFKEFVEGACMEYAYVQAGLSELNRNKIGWY